MSENKEKNHFSVMEEKTLDFWNKNGIFEKSVNKEAKNGDYTFYDGPPFATGTPHYGHIVASLMKDAVPRYWTMNGYRVERKWGWDCHGLPIENIVEKEMNSKSKKDIEALGVDKFNESCRSKVLGYVDDWKSTVNRLGRWVDMENSYKTMDLNYMESVWYVFKQMWDKGLIYEGYRSMHVCPRCETTLSQSEVTEGYKDIKDLSVTAKFKLVGEEKTYLLAWTTTPWTLISNVALAVGEEIDYVKVEFENNKYILAKELVENVFDGKEYNIVEEVKGKYLVGKAYKPLFDYYADDKGLENRENGWKVYSADFVNTEEGTGIVHIAPAFGEDDMTLGKEKALPFVQHVDMDGNFRKEAVDFVGLNVKPIKEHMSTDIEIIKYLAGKETLFSKKKYEHSYPHCWRCDTPLINYATGSWFVNVLKIKEDALKNAKNINWSPEHIKNGRFGNWLEGARDWSISRQRFWASVMPIWKCSCGEMKVFGSVEELEKASGQKVEDLHKHVVDKIKVSCEKCGGTMNRIPDVLDCWFESGSMPYAQMHYPFENKEKFDNNFPAQFIAEGADQTRTWFYYLHIISTALKGKHAFNNVIVNGIVVAEDGKKMSKRLQNYPDPNVVLEQYTADALRMYLLSSAVMRAENLSFSEKGVQESLRKNVMILWNVYKFYEMFEQEIEAKDDSENVLDKWIVAKLNKLIGVVTNSMNAYDLPRATRPITEFLNDLSTWYIRRSRDRFKSDNKDDKLLALQTTKHVLIELSKVIAPFMPFMAEDLWQKVTKNNFENVDKSVHLLEWPKANELSVEVLENMDLVKDIVELGLSKRDEAKIKVRQPLQKVIIKSKRIIDEAYNVLIKDELNIKEVEIVKYDGVLEVELDTVISPELKIEGIKRELVRSINMVRKDAKLTINDKVCISFENCNEEIKDVLGNMKDEIKKDTSSSDIREGDGCDADFSKEVKVNGCKIVLGIVKNKK